MKKLLIMACTIQSVTTLAMDQDRVTFASYRDSVGRTYQEFKHIKGEVSLFKRYMQEAGKEAVVDFRCAGETAPADNTEFTFKDPVCEELKKAHAQFSHDYPILRSHKNNDIETESSLNLKFVNYTKPHLIPYTVCYKKMNPTYSVGIPVPLGIILTNDSVAKYIDLLEKPTNTTSTPHPSYNPWKVAAYFAGATLGASKLLELTKNLFKS